LKYRTDFITNSSSSSFILHFNTKKEYENFIEDLRYLNYGELADVVENTWNMDEDTVFFIRDKKKLLECFDDYFITDVCGALKIRNKIANERGYEHWWRVEEDDPEYVELLENEIFKHKNLREEEHQNILNSEVAMQCYISDLHGGFMEYAIMQGDFLQKYYPMYCSCVSKFG